MDLLLVTNPASGSWDRETQSTLERQLAKLGEVTTFAASSAGAFADECRDAAADFDLVVIAGGDGSLSHAVNALRDRLADVTFALVPLGTGNDLATSLDLGKDPVAVAGSLERATTLSIDIGRVTAKGIDRLFVNACVGGFSVAVDESLSDEEKRKLGRFAFWLGGLRAAKDVTRYRVTVNGTCLEDVVVAGVGNGRTVGGGLELWPGASLDDGLLDVCAISAPGLVAGLRAAAKVKVGGHEEDHSVWSIAGSRIEIEAEPEMEINVDGELLGLRTPAVFEPHVDTLRLLNPQGPHS